MQRTESASIVIDNYNYARYLRDCIDSALDQTWPSEVVVVDDGSTDESRRVMESYGAAIVTVYQENRGQAAALNAAFGVASGDTIFVLDADDFADRRRVEVVMTQLEADPRAIWVRHNLRALDEESGELIAERYYAYDESSNPANEVLLRGNALGTNSALAFRRRLLQAITPIPETMYTTHPDRYLKVASSLVGRGLTIHMSLGTRRLHKGQASSYAWLDEERARFYLTLERSIARDAAAFAADSEGPVQIASGDTWWQLKALMEARRAGLESADGRPMHLRQYLSSLWKSGVPLGRRTAIAGRSVFLSLAPRRLFIPLWWLTSYGRQAALNALGSRLQVRRS